MSPNYTTIRKILLASSILIACFAVFVMFNNNQEAKADINPMFNFTGKVTDTDSVAVADNVYNFSFGLYTVATSGSAIWSEDLTAANLFSATISGVSSGASTTTYTYTGDSNESTLSVGQYLTNATTDEYALISDYNTTADTVTVVSTTAWSAAEAVNNHPRTVGGVVDIDLGSVSSPVSVDFNQTLYLQVTFDGETMQPRKLIVPVAQAFNADKLDGYDSSDFANIADDVTVTGEWDFANVVDIATTSTSTAFTVTQSGSGDIVNFFDGSEEVFTILDGGYVGIGTTTPNTALTVVTTAGGQLRLAYDGDNYADFTVSSSGELTIQTSGSSGSIITIGDGTEADAGIVLDGNAQDFWLALDDTDDTFKIGTSTTIGSSTVLTITSDGYLGIGTTTPSEQLHITNQALFNLGLGSGKGLSIEGNTGDYVQFRNYGDPAGGGFYYRAARHIFHSQEGEQYVLFDNSARVAIGNDGSPDFRLEVVGTSDKGYFGLSSAGANDGDIFIVDANGRVGIGTTSPQTLLTVYKSTDDSLISFGDANSNTAHWYMGTDYSDSSKFKIASSSLLSIAEFTFTKDGYLGIGTTSPQAALHIGTASSSNLTTYSDSLFISGELEVGETAFLGPMEFGADSGVISWIDMPVTSASATGTVQSYTARIDGTDILTIYGEASGYLGNIENTRVGIGTTTPMTTFAVEGSTTLGTTTMSVWNRVIIVDGINYSADGAGIQAAINSLPSEGGKVFIPEGTYSMTSTTTIPSNVWLEGAGASSTILRLADNANTAVLSNSDHTNGNSHIKISNLKIEGNDTNNTGEYCHGIYFNKVSYSEVNNIFVDDPEDSGIFLKSDSHYNKVLDNTIGNGGAGIKLEGEAGVANCDNNIISRNIVYSNNINAGIYLSSRTTENVVNENIVYSNIYGIGVGSYGRNTIVGNVVHSNTRNGIGITSDENTVSGNTVYNNAWHGIALSNGDDNTIIGNIVKDNDSGNSTTYDGINLSSDSDNNIISSNRFMNNDRYEINISSSDCDNNILIGNEITGTDHEDEINDVGTNTVYSSQLVGDDLILKSTGNVGIGTTSPYSRLTIWASTTTDNLLELVNTSSTTLYSISSGGNVFAHGVAATTTIQDLTAYSWTIATSTTAEPILEIDTSGNIATTSIRGGFSLGSGAFEYDYSSGITSIDSIELGSLSFDTDAGIVSWMDMPVATTTADIIMSYTAQLDGNPMLTVYGETDGSGGIKHRRIGINTASPQQTLTLGESSNIAINMATSSNVTAVAGSGTLTADEYFFRIVASDGVGTTIGSAEISTSTTFSGLDLSWTAPTGAASYRVYYATSSESYYYYFDNTDTSYTFATSTGGTAASLPSVTTAYITKLTASGDSWLLGGNLGIGTTTPTEKLHLDDGNFLQTPGNPVLTGSLSIGGVPTSVYVSGKYAYVVDAVSDDLKVIDISNPAFPVTRGSLSIDSGSQSVYVSGKYAYVVDNVSDDLKVIDVSNPASPALTGTLSVGSAPKSVYVSGRYAYVIDTTSNDLKIIDISNPASPTLSGSLGIGDYPQSVYVSGSYAYVVDALSFDLKVIDISNPASPTLSGSLGIGSAPRSVYISGRYAYVGDSGSNDLKVIDISNPASPTLSGSLGIGDYPQSVYVSGSYAYVVDSDSDDLKVINVSSSTSPTLSGSLGIGGYPESIYVSGRYAYVVDQTSEDLKIIDISGMETASMMAHSLEAGNLQVRNDILAQGQLQVTGGISIGSGGLLSHGSGAFSMATSSSLADLYAIKGNITDSNTSSIVDILNLSHMAYGSSANNIGTGLLFSSEDDYGSATSTARIASIFTNVSSTTPASALTFSTKNTSGSLTERMRIDSDGNVGIGTSSPYAALSVVDESATVSDDVFVISTSTSGAIFRVDGAGNVYADGGTITTGADYAEYFWTSDTDLVSGEVVCVDVTRDNAVKRCERGADGNVMGIVSSNPAIIGNAKAGYEDNINYKIIGMLGQVAAKVSAENGPIRPGDSLTSASSTPGHLMRAEPGDPTVGVALEAFAAAAPRLLYSSLGAKTGVINVLISRRNKSLTVEAVESRITDRIAAMEIEDEVNILIANAIDSVDFDEEIAGVIDPKLLLLTTQLTVTTDDLTGRISGINDELLVISYKLLDLDNEFGQMNTNLMQTQIDLVEQRTSLTNLTNNIMIDEDGNIKMGSGVPTATSSPSVAVVEIVTATTTEQTAFVVNQQGDGDVADFQTDGVSIVNIGDSGKVTIVGEMLIDGRIMVCSGGACGSILDERVDETMGDMGVEGTIVAGAFEGYCEAGFVWVPGSAKYGTLPGFCVQDRKSIANNIANNREYNEPWTNVSQGQAMLACQGLGDEYHLISENEWLTIAENVIRVAENDIDLELEGLQLATSTIEEAKLPIGSLASSSIAYVLTNGNVIYDLAGAIAEWTDRTVTRAGLPEPVSNEWLEYYEIENYNGFNIAPPYYYNSANGIGKIFTGDNEDGLRGFVRGTDGVFSLDLSYSPATATSTIGFRCAK